MLSQSVAAAAASISEMIKYDHFQALGPGL